MTVRHFSSICLLVLLATGATHAAADNSEYEDFVWSSLAPQKGGLSADQAAAAAVRTAPIMSQREAEIEAVRAENAGSLSSYYPNVRLLASYRRTKALEFNFSSGVAVGAQAPGALTVGACPTGAQNCVLDGAGAQVLAVAAEPFSTPQNNYTLTATLSVPVTDLLGLVSARRSSAADIDVATFKKREEAARVATNARIAFYDWVRSKAQHAVAARSLKGAQARLADATLGVSAGTVTRADALALRSLVAASRIAVAEAESFQRVAKHALVISTGLRGPLRVGEDLRSSGPTAASLGTLRELIARGQENRVEIMGAKRLSDATRHAAQTARIQYFPRIEGVASATHANPNPASFPPGPRWSSNWYLGVNATWEFDRFFNTRATVRQLDATFATASALQRNLERAIELEVRGAWEEWTRADTAARISKGQMRAAAANYQQRVLLFRGGESTSTDVVEAEVQRHDATLKNVNARINRRIALVRLQHAAGLKNGDRQ